MTKFAHSKLIKTCQQLDKKYLDTGSYAGYSLAVATPEETIFTHCSGLSDVSSGQALTNEHHFRIYSMTKPIVALALMQLYEQGLIGLSTRLDSIFPQFSSPSVCVAGIGDTSSLAPATQPILIRHLLTHTSGLTYGFNQSTPLEHLYHTHKLDYVPHFSKDEWLTAISQVPLAFTPGERFSYGVSMDVIGFVIEEITGQDLETYLHENIFAPLGMTNTTFQYKGPAEYMTSCYEKANDEPLKLQDPHDQSMFSQQPRSFSGGSGLISTQSDYLKFITCLLNNGKANGKQIIGRKTLEFMRTNHLPNNADIPSLSTGTHSEVPYHGTGFGLGFAVKLKGVESGVIASEGEYCWGGMASTFFWVDPQENFGVLFLTQLIPSSSYDVRSDLRQMIYGALN